MSHSQSPAGGAASGNRAIATETRESLMERHRAARARREAADLGSDAFRDAAEEVARIEIAIAELEEPAPKIG